MYNSTVKSLYAIFNNEYNHDNPLATFQDAPDRNMFFSYNKEDLIILQNDPVKYVYFLLKGTASALNSISWTSSEWVDTLVPLDILGLVELLNDQPAYTAFVRAETNCVVLRIPVAQFVTIIKEDANLCYHTLRVLGKVTEHNMNRAETVAIFHSLDRLGHFLYLNASGHLPYTYPYTRKKLADDLYINLRTLYRHLDTMAKDGYLKLEKGKIRIEEEHFEKLYEKYGTIIL